MRADATSRERFLLLALVALGALLRFGYLLERQAAPDFARPEIDAGFHDDWARCIAFGEERSGEWREPHEADPGLSEGVYLRPPGYPFLLATVYYCLSDPSGYVKQSLLRPVYNVLDGVVPPIFLPLVHILDGWERTDACLLIVLCQVTHYVYKVFAPTPDDLTLPCMRAFCSVTNIASTVPINRTM